MAVSRDPEALKRTARRVAREAAKGLERAALVAAQTREHVADLWAEAREEALSEVDAADFERTARSSSAPAAEPSAPPRRRRAAKPRSQPAAKSKQAAVDADATLSPDSAPRDPAS